MTRALEEILPSLLIRDLPLPEPLIVQSGSPLRAAIELMQAARRPCVIVCDGRRIKGIFTERDVLYRLGPGPIDGAVAIDDMMTAGPKTLKLTDRVADAIRLMTAEGYRHIPLLDAEGNGAGLLSARDVLGYIAEHFPAEVLNVSPRLGPVLRRMDGG
jgi:CBS domain-containing protein